MHNRKVLLRFVKQFKKRIMRKLLLILGLGLTVLTSCEKQALDNWAAGYSGETNTTEEEETEEEEEETEEEN